MEQKISRRIARAYPQPAPQPDHTEDDDHDDEDQEPAAGNDALDALAEAASSGMAGLRL